MKIYEAPIGNRYAMPQWKDLVDDDQIIYLPLDQWMAQKSRFRTLGSDGKEYAVALQRGTTLSDGDILEFFPQKRGALVVCIELSAVMEINLCKCLSKDPETIMQRAFELGHALGNQHWPAIVKGNKVYVPLTVDKTVMKSVMETHHLEDISFEFKSGREIIPFLAPHEVRRLFGGAEQGNETHHHHPHHTRTHS